MSKSLLPQLSKDIYDPKKHLKLVSYVFAMIRHHISNINDTTYFADYYEASMKTAIEHGMMEDLFLKRTDWAISGKMNSHL